MKTCRFLTRHDLLKLLDGSGDPALDADRIAHVRRCGSCRRRLVRLRDQRDALQLLAETRAQLPLTERVFQAAREAGRQRVGALLDVVSASWRGVPFDPSAVNTALAAVHVIGRRMAGLGCDIVLDRVPSQVHSEDELLESMLDVLEILEALEPAHGWDRWSPDWGHDGDQGWHQRWNQNPTADPSFLDSLAP